MSNVQPDDEHSAEHPQFVWRGNIQDTATLLGISVEAVRGRINRGKYHRTKAEDGTIYVHLKAEQLPNVHQPDAERSNVHPLIVEHLDSQIAELHDQVTFLRKELESRSEEIRRRDTIIAQLTQRIPEIGSTRDEPEAPDKPTGEPESGAEASGRDAEPEAQQMSSERPWWRRIFGG